MDEKTNQIRQTIESEREQLGRNLDEIEDRVKSATDLRAHFSKNTGVMLGAAVAGGLLLSLAFRKSSNSDSSQSEESASTSEPRAKTAAQPQRLVSKHLHHFSETFDNILSGLVGVAAAKLQSFVADAVPGFQTQYDAIDRQRGGSSLHPMNPGNPSEFSAAR